MAQSDSQQTGKQDAGDLNVPASTVAGAKSAVDSLILLVRQGRLRNDALESVRRMLALSQPAKTVEVPTDDQDLRDQVDRRLQVIQGELRRALVMTQQQPHQ